MQNNFPHPFTVFWWAFTLAWAALMFYLLSQTFVPDFSQALLARMPRFVQLRVSPGTSGFLHSLLRKLAHLREYSIFALLLYGVRGGRGQLVWRPWRAIICVPADALIP